MKNSWDYLIVTASNDAQAQAYQSQLQLRQAQGLLANFKESFVVGDPQGRRIGSGGSTACCIADILNRQLHGQSKAKPVLAAQILKQVRVLIIHAGGDSRRLPVYGPCGKIFVPIPGKDSNKVDTLFDRLLESFQSLPVPPAGRGQIVVASGDALLLFNPAEASFDKAGVTALGCYEPIEASSKHGVFCPDANGTVRLYLQKPKPEVQVRLGAVNSRNESILDVGVMSFDAEAAAALAQSCGIEYIQDRFDWKPEMRERVFDLGVDLYREICCALGSQATAEHLIAQAKAAGSKWDDAGLRRFFAVLHPIPMHIQVLSHCQFLHFGTTRQLLDSAAELVKFDSGTCPKEKRFLLNNKISQAGEISGISFWVESCAVSAPFRLAGQNIVVGVDVTEPTSLPLGACLDVVKGWDRKHSPIFFVRPHGIGDTFKDAASAKGTFCGFPLYQWISQAGLLPENIWESEILPEKQTLWDAKVFPAVKAACDFKDWLWMFDPGLATPAQKDAFLKADRYTAAEIALLTDLEEFHKRRQ